MKENEIVYNAFCAERTNTFSHSVTTMPSKFRNGRSTIGVLAGWQFYRTATNLSYLAPVFRGISRAAQDLGCNVLLGCGIGPSARPTDPMRPAWPVHLPQTDFIPIGPWNTDGLLIINPLHDTSRSDYIQNLIRAKHPVLFIGSGEAGPTIVTDNAGGIHEALHHLYDHGHREIAFIAGPLEDLGGDSGDRLSAYQSFLEKNNLEINPLRIAYGRHVYDGGYSAMQQILQSGVPFTAVLASNDESALGAMQALEEAGCRIPEDVAIIGFDNRLEGAVHEPGLSSIHVPLFNMGYQALKQMHAHLTDRLELNRTIKVEARLVTRASCGCRSTNSLSAIRSKTNAELSQHMFVTMLNQAHSLTEADVRTACAQLVNAFASSLAEDKSEKFQDALINILRQTATSDDDAHIWHAAIAILAEGYWESASATIHNILDEARMAISSEMQRQHRHYVLNERWTSSRLSLLTDRLLDALEESQIYEILAEHLPELNIHEAYLTMLEADSENPIAWSNLRNLTEQQNLIRFASHEFPPQDVFAGDQPFTLTLIPLVAHSGQLGYVVFGSEPLDLYGEIVQQLGGAFNTARLYRQAVEDRQIAEEANRMKSRFLSTISHELRTPLNLIVGLSGIVLQENEEGELSLPESAQRDVERIHAYAQHLGGLIGDVLDLATSDAGRLRLNKEVLDLSEVLRIVIESGRQLALDKNLAWKATLPEHGPWVLGDRTRLRQVALNLVNNAIKFTTHGEVSLNVEVSADRVIVSVHDTGLGIPLEEQATIFNEFDRSERSISLGYSGLGLGLAICKRLVEMHAGTIGVTSSGETGSGSTFYFTLPIVPAPDGETDQPNQPTNNQRIVMIVTDQQSLNEQLLERLKQTGFNTQVITVDSSSTWQSKLFSALPDILLLDVRLKSHQSWDVLRLIQENPLAQKIPILLYRSAPDGSAIIELEYLTKPVELETLTHMLDEQLLTGKTDQPARTILVVDDDSNTLEMHARIVQSHSPTHRVLQADHGRQALEILERESIDLVLLDLQMPEMDGFEVLEKMRAQPALRKIPVIVLTGRVLSEADMTRLSQGVVTILEKGMFSLDETVTHISTALERKRKLSGETQRLVRKAMAFIHEHFAEPISRTEIAQHVSIAEDYLTFCFRQELGTTPIKYLQRYRILQAKQLLLTGQKTITEIALLVGFSDSGYFSRLFHRETGLSPEAFRHA